VSGGVTTDYEYNSLNQMTEADNGTTATTFTYDFNGNRITRVMGGNTDTYTYDFENRLVGLTKTTTGGVGAYAYTYDYRTRRVLRGETPAGGSLTATKVVFAGGTSCQELTVGGSSTPVVEYVRGSDYGGGVGGILYTLRGGTPSYTHYNNRGDVVAKTAANGSLTYEAQYEAYGKRTAEQGSTDDRQKANTKDEDPTGLLNEGFRYRDLETGTFITRDPLMFVDGPNMYAYVVQNPWTKFDPEGLWVEDLVVAPVSIGLGVASFVDNVRSKNVGAAVVDAVGVGADIGAIFVPGVPGAAGLSIKAARASEKGLDALQAAKQTAKAADAAKDTANKVDNVADANKASKADNVSPTTSAKDTNTQTAQERGRQSEGRVLDDMGQKKNTEKVTGSEGNSIPDFVNSKQVGDIKDTKVVTDSKQLRIQREAGANQNKEHVVVTGTNTKVSTTVKTKSTVVRRDDLGPQKKKEE
jgi:RHS repeat-associated protein